MLSSTSRIRFPFRSGYAEVLSVPVFAEEAQEPITLTVFRGDPGECELHEENELDVTGRLIGGCIDVIDECIGTPYIDLNGFAERYKSDGLIWFFDNFELTPMGLMYSMNRLIQMGLFENAKADIEKAIKLDSKYAE